MADDEWMVFDDSDSPYLAWLASHPTGFVLNTERTRRPAYMVLHRASCGAIAEYRGEAQPGGFTERQYIKVCAPSVSALIAWVRAHGRPDGSFSKRCGHCAPA